STSDGMLVNEDEVTSTLVVDSDGNLYVAVSSSQPYNSVRIKLRNQLSLLGLSLGSSLNLNVYDAFTLDVEACAPAIFSDIGKVTGVNVNLAETVINPEFAIDENTSNFSEIKLGLLSAGATASQNIYFP